jgi:hypothetical protein
MFLEPRHALTQGYKAVYRFALRALVDVARIAGYCVGLVERIRR